MASNQDIRAWAQAQGITLHSHKGPVRKEVRAQYDAAHTLTDTPDAPDVDGPVADPPAPGEAPSTPPAAEQPPAGGWFTPIGETPPQTPPPAAEQPPKTGRARSPWQRWRDRRSSGTPRPVRARQSTEALFGSLWGFLARRAEELDLYPLARTLDFQAPVAGIILDQTVRGTFSDVVLQPLARIYNKTDDIGALIAMPVLVQMVVARPDLAPQLRPHLINAIYRWHEIAGPALAKKKRELERRNEALGINPEEILAMIFAPWGDADLSGETHAA